MGVLPYLKKKYLRYDYYKEQSVEDIFTKEQLHKATKLDAFEMRSSVILNLGNGTFKMKPLHTEAQFSPVYGILVKDFDGDGNPDILLGGSFYQSKPEAGIYETSYGMLRKGNGKREFTAVDESQSGFLIKGQVRDMTLLK